MSAKVRHARLWGTRQRKYKWPAEAHVGSVELPPNEASL